MYYQDMSAYSYYLDFSLSNVKNVGWLDEKHDFIKGLVEVSLVEKLCKILIGAKSTDVHVNPIRGTHFCNICGEERAITCGENRIFLGRSEMWIPSEKEGEYFASPSLLLHYIKNHNYLPPRQFTASVHQFSLGSKFNAQELYLSLVN